MTDGNEHGPATPTHIEMAAFDRLEPWVREAVREAPRLLDSPSVLDMWNRLMAPAATKPQRKRAETTFRRWLQTYLDHAARTYREDIERGLNP